jgi:hypothetical protein
MAAMRFSSIAAFALVALTGNATVAPPTPPPSVCPEGTTIVCAVKDGEMQSYWNVCDAKRDGALVMSAGECPAGTHESGP